ncbi:hypothetical protein B0H13DRAFT_1924072 [Mycena leptocephala]|nr:hypothetical protein B0H13DRAFT_1924072 [Mycena leptocephala]
MSLLPGWVSRQAAVAGGTTGKFGVDTAPEIRKIIPNLCKQLGTCLSGAWTTPLLVYAYVFNKNPSSALLHPRLILCYSLPDPHGTPQIWILKPSSTSKHLKASNAPISQGTQVRTHKSSPSTKPQAPYTQTFFIKPAFKLASNFCLLLWSLEPVLVRYLVATGAVPMYEQFVRALIFYQVEWLVAKSCIAFQRGGDPDVEQLSTQLEVSRTGCTLVPFATWAGSQP